MQNRTGVLAAAIFLRMLSIIVMVIGIAAIILAIIALGDPRSYQVVFRLDEFANFVELILMGFVLLVLSKLIEMTLKLEEDLYNLTRLVQRQIKQNRDKEPPKE